MYDTVETLTYKGYSINVKIDHDCQSPREWDGKICSIIMQSRDYDLNETDIDLREFREYGESRLDGEALEARIKKDLNPVFLLKLHAYIHSGIALSLSPWRDGDLPQGHARFDSGQIGLVIMTRRNVRDCFGQNKAKYMTKKFKGYLYEQIEGEIELLSDYLNGYCYGYQVEGLKEDAFDSCWGYYGGDHEKSGLLEGAQGTIDYELQKEGENLSPFAFIGGVV